MYGTFTTIYSGAGKKVATRPRDSFRRSGLRGIAVVARWFPITSLVGGINRIPRRPERNQTTSHRNMPLY